MKRILIILYFLPTFTFASDHSYKSLLQIDSLPDVFLIGEHEFEYENLVNSCEGLLLEVCSDSMQLAYKHWLLMLNDLEIFAAAEEFDIRGIKIWLNVFWNEDGKIEKLVYYPKPNSRNIDFSKLTAVMESFRERYEFPIEVDKCFSHYGSATFPTFAELYFEEGGK